MMRRNYYKRNEFDAIIWLSRNERRGVKELKLLMNRIFDNFPSIMCDNRKVLTKTTSYLIESGHKEIGFINLASKHLYQERKEAYFDTMLEAGLNPENSIWNAKATQLPL